MLKRKARIPSKACVACGCCIAVCPVQAITITSGCYAKVDTDTCIGCGKCSKECPASIIYIEETTK